MNYQKQNIMEKITTVSLSFCTHTHILIHPHKLKDMPHTDAHNPTHMTVSNGGAKIDIMTMKRPNDWLCLKIHTHAARIIEREVTQRKRERERERERADGARKSRSVQYTELAIMAAS